MIFYYAAGGGLGHLTRARAFLHTLRIQEQTVILTASDFANDKRVTGELEIVKIPLHFASEPVAYRNWLRDLFHAQQPSAIYLDAFPVGIVGEFCDFDFPSQTGLYYVARLLRWDVYSRLICGNAPRFKITYTLEELEDPHRDFLRSCSTSVERLHLEDVSYDVTFAEQEMIESVKNGQLPFWLIVHSGSEEEVRELIAFAEECRQLEKAQANLILIAPHCPANLPVTHLNFYPAHLLFPYAEKIFTACGFHAMRQTEKNKHKHRFMPFARRFDNQFQRAARRHCEI